MFVHRGRTAECLATGRVRVGTIQTLTCVDLAAELALFQGLRPGVQVSLREATTPELIDAVRAGELDLAYLAPDAARLPDGVTVFATWHENLVLITAPGHPPGTRSSRTSPASRSWTSGRASVWQSCRAGGPVPAPAVRGAGRAAAGPPAGRRPPAG